MEVLLAQLVVTTISVTGGALLALLIDRGKTRRNERLAEVNALRLLIAEIASRRALAPEQTNGPITLDRADPDSGFNRVMRSVVLLRKDIRAARRALRPRSGAWAPINAMVATCNVFIESVDEEPRRIAGELELLRTDLDTLLGEVCAVHPQLEFQGAGSAAYRRPAARFTA